MEGTVFLEARREEDAEAARAVWLSSTKGDAVSDAVWRAITRVIYNGVSVDDSVSTLQGGIRGLFPLLR